MVTYGDRVVTNALTGLSDQDMAEIKASKWFGEHYLKFRTSEKNGKLVGTWDGGWYFVAHNNNIGVYRRNEFEILPEEV